MLGIYSEAALDGYCDEMNHFARQYGQMCWPTIYRYDVLARRTHIEYCRRERAEDDDEALKKKLFSSATTPRCHGTVPWMPSSRIAITGRRMSLTPALP